MQPAIHDVSSINVCIRYPPPTKGVYGLPERLVVLEMIVYPDKRNGPKHREEHNRGRRARGAHTRQQQPNHRRQYHQGITVVKEPQKSHEQKVTEGQPAEECLPRAVDRPKEGGEKNRR
jgi:hypothetical protein